VTVNAGWTTRLKWAPDCDLSGAPGAVIRRSVGHPAHRGVGVGGAERSSFLSSLAGWSRRSPREPRRLSREQKEANGSKGGTSGVLDRVVAARVRGSGVPRRAQSFSQGHRRRGFVQAAEPWSGRVDATLGRSSGIVGPGGDRMTMIAATHLSSGDGHLSLLLHILNGIRTPAERAAWVHACLPVSSTLLDLPDLGGEPTWRVEEPPSKPRMTGRRLERRAVMGKQGHFRIRLCQDCGARYWPTHWRAVACPGCAARRALKTCRCGVVFNPRKWQVTCDACLAIRELPPHQRRPRRPNHFTVKPCLDCARCYTPASARSWYCPECSARRNPPPAFHRRDSTLLARLCVICAQEYTPHSSPQRMCSDACRRVQRQRWRDRVGAAYHAQWYATNGRTLPSNPCLPASPGEDVPVMVL
jgi:hypothetical protein